MSLGSYSPCTSISTGCSSRSRSLFSSLSFSLPPSSILSREGEVLPLSLPRASSAAAHRLALRLALVSLQRLKQLKQIEKYKIWTYDDDDGPGEARSGGRRDSKGDECSFFGFLMGCKRFVNLLRVNLGMNSHMKSGSGVHRAER
jgi:hypothetical protein